MSYHFNKGNFISEGIQSIKLDESLFDDFIFHATICWYHASCMGEYLSYFFLSFAYHFTLPKVSVSDAIKPIWNSMSDFCECWRNGEQFHHNRIRKLMKE